MKEQYPTSAIKKKIQPNSMENLLDTPSGS